MRRMNSLLASLALAVAPLLGMFPNKSGFASWYGEAYRGLVCADGKTRFNPDKLTCASWDHPFGTRLRVSTADGKRSVIVTVTDRGPARKYYREGRIVDLSRRAFERLAPKEKGLVRVRVEVLR